MFKHVKGGVHES